MNSPESPVYHKGEVLYGLPWARHAIRREGQALVVEGYMDVVSLAAAGFDNAVAPLGTAVTGEQARLLRRYAQRVLLLFDADRAGLEATFRAGDVLLEAGLHPAAVTLPPREDPDTLVRKEGKAGLERYLDDAVDVLDRKLKILEERDWFRDIERTRQAVDRLLPTLRAAADDTLRDLYVARVSERTGVRRETLEAELASPPGRHGPATASRGPAGSRRIRRGAGRGPRLERPMGPERYTCLVLALDRRRREELLERALRQIGPEDFTDPAYRAIFQAFLADPDLEAPPPGMDAGAARRLQELLEDPEDLQHADQILAESLARIRQAAMNRKGAELEAALAAASTEEEKVRIVQEKNRLRQEIRSIGLDWPQTARSLWSAPQDPTDRE